MKSNVVEMAPLVKVRKDVLERWKEATLKIGWKLRDLKGFKYQVLAADLDELNADIRYWLEEDGVDL